MKNGKKGLRKSEIWKEKKRKVNKAKHQLSKRETKKIARNQKDIDIAKRAFYHIAYFVESIGE